MMQEFDFQTYVLRRRADSSKPVIRIQNYAYIEDIEWLRKLAGRDIVQQAMGIGIQAWKLSQSRRIFAQSRELRGDDRVLQPWADACFTFGHSPMPLRIYPAQKTFIDAWGGSDGTYFTLSGEAHALPVRALKFIFGRAVGALDNSHVPWLTLTHFADDLTRGIWTRAAQIPDMLLNWQLNAEITEDRAGILASRDISAAILVIMKSSLDWGDDEIMREIRRYHENLDVDWGEDEIEKRVRAIELFMESRLYKHTSGRTIKEVDDEVRKLYSIF